MATAVLEQKCWVLCFSKDEIRAHFKDTLDCKAVTESDFKSEQHPQQTSTALDRILKPQQQCEPNAYL